MTAKETGTPTLFLCLGLDPWDYKRIRFAHVTAEEFEAGEDLTPSLSGLPEWGDDRLHSYARGRAKKWGKFGGFPSCGVVYEIDANLREDGGTIWPGSMVHKGLWPDSADRQRGGSANDARTREMEGLRDTEPSQYIQLTQEVMDYYGRRKRADERADRGPDDDGAVGGAGDAGEDGDY